MTFVLATIEAGHIFIFADTRVMEGDLPLPRTSGVVKTCFVTPTLAVSFANSPELAAKDINRFVFDGEPSKYSNTVEFFAASSREAGTERVIVLRAQIRVRDHPAARGHAP
ncbi:MAG: hypothetical protein JO245_09120 [Pseudolabrys sp.]|nr:hypothetical protein [Pseudolabrys sp.]